MQQFSSYLRPKGEAFPGQIAILRLAARQARRAAIDSMKWRVGAEREQVQSE